MASAQFDTLAAANELRAAGIAEAHAEAIVNTVGQATGGLLTESRFDTAMDELRRDMETGFAKQASALEVGLARQAVALAEFKGEIYRYLWLQGGSIIVILSSLYMLAESWSRAQG